MGGVLHLGDYIYENPPRGKPPRRHAGGEPADLAGYRARHAQYKTDRDLQAAHARHPFVTAWDDHEVENDYAGRHPVEGGDPAAFLRRRAAAYRAYWEHLPLRRPPRGATMPLYPRLRFGDLAELNLLDTHQYRDDQPCGEDGPGGGRVVTCPERVDPRRTILGHHQRRWLLRGPDRPVVATELVGTSISSGASKSSGFRKHLADNPTSASSRAACAATPAAPCSASAGTPTCGS